MTDLDKLAKYANGNAEYALFADLTGSNPAPRWFGHQFRERDFTFA